MNIWDLESCSFPEKEWVIPPYGTARFDISIRAFGLEEKGIQEDITSFVATGLTLRSLPNDEQDEHNIPIFIQYEALRGKINLWDTNSSAIALHEHVVGTGSMDNVTEEAIEIQVPAVVYPHTWTKVDEILPSTGVPISLSSTFSDDFTLKGLVICNEWFTFKSYEDHPITISGSKSNDKGYEIGDVFATVPCHSFFYQCALEWLEKRDTIQPLECGRPIPNQNERKQKEVKMNAIDKLQEAHAFMVSRFSLVEDGGKQAPGPSSFYNVGGKDYHPSNNNKGMGYLNNPLLPTPVEVFEKAFRAWDLVVHYNLHKMSSKIRAWTDQLNTTTRKLFISIPDVYLTSELTLPRLFSQQIVEFPTTQIASVSQQYITVRNPTNFVISVKLVAEERSDLFFQYSATEVNPWWTGGNYFCMDLDGNLIQSNHNVTIKSSGGAYVSLVNPSLHSSSAFLMGCGKKCGLRNEPMEKPSMPIGAAAAMGSSLPRSSVHGSGSGITAPPPPFALPLRSSSTEVEVKPMAEVKLGPIFFRPPGRGKFESRIYIENSMTGLERITLKGRGALEKLVFEETEYRMGYPTVVFSGKEKTPEVRAVTVSNVGDVALNITKIYMGTAEILYFTNLRPWPSLSSKKLAEWRKQQCHARGFTLLNCSDLQQNGFEILPGLNRTLHIEYKSDCIFQTSYSSLHFEYGETSRIDLKRKKVELLVGYDLSAKEMRTCRPCCSSDNTAFAGWKFLASISLMSLFFLIHVLYFVKNQSSFSACTDFRNSFYRMTLLTKSTITTADDLFCAGKEQNKQFLSKLKKMSIFPPHCILSNGEFAARQTFPQHSSSQTYKNCIANGVSSSSAGGTSNTSSNDVLFGSAAAMTSSGSDHTESYSDDTMLLLPMGLGWRAAVARNLLKEDLECWIELEDNKDNSMSRVQELLLKRCKEEHTKQQEHQGHMEEHKEEQQEGNDGVDDDEEVDEADILLQKRDIKDTASGSPVASAAGVVELPATLGLTKKSKSDASSAGSSVNSADNKGGKNGNKSKWTKKISSTSSKANQNANSNMFHKVHEKKHSVPPPPHPSSTPPKRTHPSKTPTSYREAIVGRNTKAAQISSGKARKKAPPASAGGSHSNPPLHPKIQHHHQHSKKNNPPLSPSSSGSSRVSSLSLSDGGIYPSSPPPSPVVRDSSVGSDMSGNQALESSWNNQYPLPQSRPEDIIPTATAVPTEQPTKLLSSLLESNYKPAVTPTAKAPIIGPPPGILPPPGFAPATPELPMLPTLGGGTPIISADENLHLPTPPASFASTDDHPATDTAVQNTADTQSTLFASSSAGSDIKPAIKPIGSEMKGNDELLRNVEEQPPPPLDALFGTNGFDVEQFLYGILNGSEEEDKGFETGNAAAIQPQRNEERRRVPRALAYGIHVEEQQQPQQQNQDSFEMSLLTPAMLVEEKEGKEDEQDYCFARDSSFLDNLVGE